MPQRRRAGRPRSRRGSLAQPAMASTVVTVPPSQPTSSVARLAAVMGDQRPPRRAHSRFPGHALTPTGVMAIRCKQFHLPDL